MKRISTLVFAVAISSIALFSCTDKEGSTTEGASVLNNAEDSLSYALGLNIGENIKKSGFEEVNSSAIAKGISDVYAETPAMTIEAAGAFLDAYMTAQAAEKAEANKAASQGWFEAFDSKGASAEVITTASGLKYQVIEEGTGVSPVATDMVEVHYHGMLLDGTVFDSSVDRGETATFPLNGVIPGWTEGLQLMKEGGKTRFTIPSELAYGENGAGQIIGPNATLVFDVELIKVGQ